MLLRPIVRFRPFGTWCLEAGIRTTFNVPGAGHVLEVRRPDVVHVLGIERPQHIRLTQRRPTGIVGALEVLLGGIERHRLVEIQIAHVIDRQLGVEAEAVGEVEFHGGLGSLRGEGY
ncbi:hypothetical protein D3C84_547900 [compost metagenome]